MDEVVTQELSSRLVAFLKTIPLQSIRSPLVSLIGHGSSGLHMMTAAELRRQLALHSSFLSVTAVIIAGALWPAIQSLATPKPSRWVRRVSEVAEIWLIFLALHWSAAVTSVTVANRLVEQNSHLSGYERQELIVAPFANSFASPGLALLFGEVASTVTIQCG